MVAVGAEESETVSLHEKSLDKLVPSLKPTDWINDGLDMVNVGFGIANDLLASGTPVLIASNSRKLSALVFWPPPTGSPTQCRCNETTESRRGPLTIVVGLRNV